MSIPGDEERLIDAVEDVDGDVVVCGDVDDGATSQPPPLAA